MNYIFKYVPRNDLFCTERNVCVRNLSVVKRIPIKILRQFFPLATQVTSEHSDTRVYLAQRQ